MLADPFAPQPLEYSYALADLHAHFLGASQKAGNAYAEQEAKGSAFGVPFTRAALHHALEQVKLTEAKSVRVLHGRLHPSLFHHWCRSLR